MPRRRNVLPDLAQSGCFPQSRLIPPQEGAIVVSSGKMVRLAAVLFGLGLIVQPAARAAEPLPEDPRRPPRPRREFGRLTFALTGGVQWWLLDSLEEFLDQRAEFYSPYGYELGSASFGVGGGFGADIQWRLARGFFLRSQFEWTRVEWEARDRRVLEVLGDRQPVSLTYRTRVGTSPLVASFGLGWGAELTKVRLALAAGMVVAPLTVTDVLQVYFGAAGTETEVEAKGTGIGLDTAFTIDYFTDVPMTLFLELFWRYGRTRVELENEALESTTLPGERVVDFTGVGLRLGARWI